MPNDQYKSDALRLVQNDDLLKNLFKSRRHNSPARTQDTFRTHPIGRLATDGSSGRESIYSQINWIKIPTRENESDPGTNTYISMLSVKTYTKNQCRRISERFLDGNIVLSNYGDVTVQDSTIDAGYDIYHNSIIYSKPEIERRPSTDNYVGQRSLTERRFLDYSDYYLFSTNLKWIVYKIPNKHWNSATPPEITPGSPNDTQIPVYVLLYNTIHRRNFQDVYTKMLQHSFVNQSGGSCMTNPRPVCRYAAYSDVALDNDYDSVQQSIIKYCNAFTSAADPSERSGRPLKKYGDPSCAVAVDPTLATMNYVHRNNYTKHSLERNFYDVPEGLSQSTGYVLATAGYNIAAHNLERDLNGRVGYIWDAYCTGGAQLTDIRSAVEYLRNRSLIVSSGCASNNESDSFMQQLVSHNIRHANIAIAGSGVSSLRQNQPHTQRRGWNECQGQQPPPVVSGYSFSFNGCLYPTSTIVRINCNLEFDVGGGLNMDQNNFNQYCGNDRIRPTQEDMNMLGQIISDGQTIDDNSELLIYFIIIIVLLIVIGIGFYLVLKKK